jgi:hypothetical protein
MPRNRIIDVYENCYFYYENFYNLINTRCGQIALSFLTCFKDLTSSFIMCRFIWLL